MAAIFSNLEEKKTVKSWAKRNFFKVAKVSIVLTLIMSVGAIIEHKYRIVAGVSHLAVAKKAK